MSAEVSECQVLIFTQTGTPLDVLDVSVTRSWLLNDIGQCTFTIASKDPKCTERNLRFGNLVYVSSDVLPDWVGVIDTPRGRNYGSISVTAYSAEYLLQLRVIQSYQTVKGTTGALFKAVLGAVKSAGGAVIEPNGDLDHIGWPTGANYNFDLITAFETISNIVKSYGGDWDVSPALDTAGRLHLLGNYYKVKGSIRNDYVIDESNSELVLGNKVEEQGPFHNDVRGFGNDAKPASRVLFTAKNQASIDLYGPHQVALSVESNEIAAVKKSAAAYLADNLFPPKIFTISMDNRNDVWRNIRMGDIAHVMFSWGAFYGGDGEIDSWVRITGMAVSEMAGKLALTVQEV